MSILAWGAITPPHPPISTAFPDTIVTTTQIDTAVDTLVSATVHPAPIVTLTTMPTPLQASVVQPATIVTVTDVPSGSSVQESVVITPDVIVTSTSAPAPGIGSYTIRPATIVTTTQVLTPPATAVVPLSIVVRTPVSGPVVVVAPFGPNGDLRDLYAVQLRRPDRALVGQVTDWTQIKALPTFNGVGTYAVDFPLGQYVNLLEPGGGLLVTRHGQVLIDGPYTNITQTRSKEAPDGTITLSGVSNEHVVSDRLAYRDPAHAANAQTTALDTRTGLAETIIYAYVNANAGPAALPARVTPGLALAPDLARGSLLTGNATFDVLSDLITTLALTDDLGWRVNPVGTGLVFEVYQPRDLTATVRFSWDLANILSYTYGTGGPAVTRETVLGAGTGTARVIVEVGDPTSEGEWSRRIEKVLDQSSTADVTTLTQAGIQQLATDQPALNLTIQPTDTATAAFGIDWALGDKVTVIVAGAELSQVVRQVDVTVNELGEVLFPVVGIPGTTNIPYVYTQTRALTKAIQDQQRRR